jgi:transcriptional regulator NrdR family protein
MANKTKHIVKRGKHTEEYDQRKLYASIYNACIAVRCTDTEAELIAERIVQLVEEWLEPKHEVTSYDITRIASEHFQQYHPDAGYLYEHHRSIS